MSSLARKFSLAIATLMLTTGCSTPIATPMDQIGINITQDRFEITVPKSQLLLSLPKGDLQAISNEGIGATASPRYFMLTGKASGSVVSGWFEPAERQRDLRTSWNIEMEGLKRNGFGPPTDVVESEINGMKAILYNVPLPKGSSAHARCSHLQSGTWIDLHLSVSGNKLPGESREQLIALLNSLRVTSK
jgi:hypothetical protein